MPKYYITEEDIDGLYETVSGTSYRVDAIDVDRVHIPKGRKGEWLPFDTEDEYLNSMGLKRKPNKDV